MNLNIGVKGEYTIRIHYQNMFTDTIFELKGTNLITLLGESFFLNRCINEFFKPIEYIVVGNNNNRPQKLDKGLGNETNRKTCVKTANLDTKQLILVANFTASQMKGVCEIGVANDDILISHDVFEKIDDTLLTNSVGDIEVEYTFQLSTSSIRNDWIYSEHHNLSENHGVYYVIEPNEVIGVMELDTGDGYHKVSSVSEMYYKNQCYYYDMGLKHLYLKKSDTSNPNNYNIIVQNK